MVFNCNFGWYGIKNGITNQTLGKILRCSMNRHIYQNIEVIAYSFFFILIFIETGFRLKKLTVVIGWLIFGKHLVAPIKITHVVTVPVWQYYETCMTSSVFPQGHCCNPVWMCGMKISGWILFWLSCSFPTVPLSHTRCCTMSQSMLTIAILPTNISHLYTKPTFKHCSFRSRVSDGNASH